MTLPKPTQEKFLAYSAKMAAVAMSPFLEDYNDSEDWQKEHALAGLLASLRHWADREELRFERAATLGRVWYEAELEDPKIAAAKLAKETA